VSACPEMLGGLGTPRLPSEIISSNGVRRVIARDGRDVTGAFEDGARTVAEQAQAQDVRVAVLKDGSPSCGTSFIYDGTFSKTKVPGGQGITAALLRERGFAVFSEEQFDAADEYVARLERGRA